MKSSSKTILIFLAIVTAGACGRETVYKDEPTVVDPGPAPSPGPGPGPVGLTWARDIEPIAVESCGQAGCHAGAGFLRSEAAFRASDVKRRISNDSMPLRQAANYYLWEDGSRKTKILQFLNGSGG